MKTRSFFARAIAVLLVVAMATALAACGGGAKSTPKPQATAAPTATPAPTNTPTPEPQPTQAETTELDSLISHLKLLAPVRVVSTFTAKEGDNPESVTRTEAEIDAAGNQRVRLYEGENLTAEFLFVDKQMYMGTGENQYVALGPQDDPWEALMLYGGAFLLVFNNLCIGDNQPSMRLSPDHQATAAQQRRCPAPHPIFRIADVAPGCAASRVRPSPQFAREPRQHAVLPRSGFAPLLPE